MKRWLLCSLYPLGVYASEESVEQAFRRYRESSLAFRVEGERMTRIGAWPMNRSRVSDGSEAPRLAKTLTPRQRAEWYLREAGDPPLPPSDLRAIEEASLVDENLRTEFDRSFPSFFDRPETLEAKLAAFGQRLKSLWRPEFERSPSAGLWSYLRTDRGEGVQADPRYAALIEFRRGLGLGPGARVTAWFKARAELNKGETRLRIERADLDATLVDYVVHGWGEDAAFLKLVGTWRDEALRENLVELTPRLVDEWVRAKRPASSAELLALGLRFAREKGEPADGSSLADIARLQADAGRDELAFAFFQEALGRAGRDATIRAELRLALADLSDRAAERADGPTDKRRFRSWEIEYLRMILDESPSFLDRDGVAERYGLALASAGRVDEGIRVFEVVYSNSVSDSAKVRSLGLSADILREALRRGVSPKEERRYLEKWVEKVGFLARLRSGPELAEHVRAIAERLDRIGITGLDPLRASLREIREASRKETQAR
mgnify:CR=1 FL=1